MSERFDLIVRNATVVDGTRAPRYVADVGVRGDRIAAIGSLKIIARKPILMRPAKSCRRDSSTRTRTTTG